MAPDLSFRDGCPVLQARHTGVSDRFFMVALSILGGSYVLLIVMLLAGDVAYLVSQSLGETLSRNPILTVLRKSEVRYSIFLSLFSCSMSAVLAMLVAVPMGYALSRLRWVGRRWIDAILDIPIILPPLVIGLSLLILFQFKPFTTPLGQWWPFPGSWHDMTLNRLVVYQVPAVILAQFAVAGAFAVRTMKAAFDQTNPRCEQVALALGCSRRQAFFKVTLPEVRKGMLTAVTLAWARALGEFGPLLIFAGATRHKTEVLSTTVFLELSIGNLEAAVSVSLIMVVAAMLVILLARNWGVREAGL